MLIPKFCRFPWLPVFILLVAVIFISVIFTYSQPVNHNKFYRIDSNKDGRVLGVSEAATEYRPERLSTNTNILPKNNWISLIPEKNSQAEAAPFLACSSAAVLDLSSGKIIFDRAADRQMPIASITKLVTALVFLEYNPGWDDVCQVKPQDRVEGGRIYLSRGERVRVRDLFYLSMVGSANTATKALVRTTGMSEEDFVSQMNRKVESLGLGHTHFLDPIGLNSSNVSTAPEVAKLAAAALAINDIREATLTKKYEFFTLDKRKKVVYNTDVLLDIFPQNGIKILGGKTGFTDLAGYCFTGRFVNADGNEIIAVVLGSKNKISRFEETKKLAEWIFQSFKWPGIPDVLPSAY